MHSTHAPSPGAGLVSVVSVGSVLAAVGSVVGHEVELGDRLEADLAIDSVDLLRIGAALSFDLSAHLAGFDFDRLVELTVADLVP